ncbi:hypothetical protein [Streptomyces cacaoi]|uniref:CdiI immunity protein domain-containing protein n=1 Tax=Streptomyces cacaoi TaxID=1898 RepID=A0A4Y3QTR1_STRCI|nr:hypothetical protein [Streptomyces cacaoi]NNG89300.1 hypothetical protein [Streptomyces cacaoi]GEB48794.1 hypothetical protein SCA03_13450 [Streptomyces cacaoi]
MARADHAEFFAFEGARTLLAPYRRPRTLPRARDVWEPALAPLARGIWFRQQRGGRTLYEVAAQLRQAAGFADGHSPEELGERFAFPVTDPARDTSAVLREIADYAATWTERPTAERLRSAPRTTGELRLFFPMLTRRLGSYFGQGGLAVENDMADATAEDGIRMWIGQSHPNDCEGELPALAAECNEALALFHTEDELDRFFCQENHGGSGDADFTEFLPMLAGLCIEHMREHHPLSWERR